ncbi:putative nucleic acid-binding protein [Lupinus albus]|uniref:Putative nucleic acid-binding protein n=1 Tax=Lupinus albus TaxID=3870 RepID=A0A6A4PSD8_LUPAL|nr:putative nucleic acid-binding protein [Lupinus albus]
MSISNTFDMIKDINESKQLWKIVVRITNLWYVQMPPRSDHLDMILMDSKGDKIQVFALNVGFNIWRHYLVEGKTYMIQNFYVIPNDLQFKSRHHLYRIQFHGSTTIGRIEYPAIPPTQYDFKKFPEILSGNFRTHLLIC